MRTNLIKPKESPKSEIKEGYHDMVVAFDTTGSMSSYLAAVRNRVKEIIPELLNANPNMRMGIIAFGDYCDMRSSTDFGNAYQVCPLTKDQNKLINFVNSAHTTSGGDTDEFYELVIKKIVEETDWRENAVKSVLLIADCGPHPVGYSFGSIVHNSQIDWRAEARKAASKGIQFDTLSLTGYSWYKELSEMTNGVYAPFKSDKKTTEAVKMSAYSRGGEATRAYFVNNVKNYSEVLHDSELTAMSCAYAKKVEGIDDVMNAAVSSVSLGGEVLGGMDLEAVGVVMTRVTPELIPEPSTTTKESRKVKGMKIDVTEIQVGDIFSEESHYTVTKVNTDDIVLHHLESGKEVTLTKKYVQELLNTSDQYNTEMTVGKEDKKDGTPGIRTIFEGIKSSEVFTVVFKKQDKPKTKKAIAEEKEAQRATALELIEAAKRRKKSMAEAYKEALVFVQNNPISDIIPGEDRVLRGYKVQFVSRDGKYMCKDMDIVPTEKDNGIRPVNINTISQLIYNGVKYTVE